jgi:orotate phosphoribosyltransferase
MQSFEAYKPRLLELVSRPEVLQRLPQPVQLASGEWSHVFIDGKRAVDEPEGLRLVGEAMLAAARSTGAEFEAVGGLVLGAVPFAFAVAGAANCKWFLVRKEPKGRGTNLWIEGTPLHDGMKIMLVDDVVTTGGSARKAYERVRAQGAEVVFSSALVDRGEGTATFFTGEGVPYIPMLTYRDLGIEPVSKT